VQLRHRSANAGGAGRALRRRPARRARQEWFPGATASSLELTLARRGATAKAGSAGWQGGLLPSFSLTHVSNAAALPSSASEARRGRAGRRVLG